MESLADYLGRLKAQAEWPQEPDASKKLLASAGMTMMPADAISEPMLAPAGSQAYQQMPAQEVELAEALASAGISDALLASAGRTLALLASELASAGVAVLPKRTKAAGGRARFACMSEEEKRAFQQNAAKQRWKKKLAIGYSRMRVDKMPGAR